MNILFLTLIDFDSIEEHGIYQDLLREFIKHNNNVYVISPVEKRKKSNTRLIKKENGAILKLKIGNVQKTNWLEKGLSTVSLEEKVIKGIKKYYSDIKFDLVLYSTPPITLQKAVEFVKKRDNASTYLLLKDIFPQNAVDMGMMSKKGVKALLYRYFRNKEKALYELSDKIGCMSNANVEYVLKHNPTIEKERVEVCPNSVEIIDMRISEESRHEIRVKYDLPLDKKVFLYGGNLGKPQGVPFIIESLKNQLKNTEAYFLIVGDGTEYSRLSRFFDEYKPSNMKLMKRMPKDDYDRMVAACDVGMIFLDYRFTIPNFPSRLLSLMQAGLPVLACTDVNSDIGQVCENGGFGWWCKSNDISCFATMIKEIINADLKKMGTIGYEYLKSNYDVELGYKVIMSHE